MQCNAYASAFYCSCIVLGMKQLDHSSIYRVERDAVVTVWKASYAQLIWGCPDLLYIWSISHIYPYISHICMLIPSEQGSFI